MFNKKAKEKQRHLSLFDGLTLSVLGDLEGEESRGWTQMLRQKHCPPEYALYDYMPRGLRKRYEVRAAKALANGAAEPERASRKPGADGGTQQSSRKEELGRQSRASGSSHATEAGPAPRSSGGSKAPDERELRPEDSASQTCRSHGSHGKGRE